MLAHARNILPILAFVALLLSGSADAQSNARVVAPYGSDSNPGTIRQPYLTIQKCATTVAAGWTCEVRAGTYHETVTPNSGIVITSYPGERVTLTVPIRSLAGLSTRVPFTRLA